jgi:hypothetical protein
VIEISIAPVIPPAIPANKGVSSFAYAFGYALAIFFYFIFFLTELFKN